jgi:uncharacterized membrane protein (UPF0127 family)
MRLIPLIIAVAAIITLIMNQKTSDEILKIKTQAKTYDIYVQVADTTEERASGLMGEKSLGEFDGMLFIFDEELIPSFWMKNMKMPLDMVFIGADKKIKHIVQSVPPCTTSENECVRYDSPIPVKYVLELNAGFAEKYGVSIEDETMFQ